MNENMNYIEGKAIIWHAYDRISMSQIEDKSIFMFLLHLCRQKIFVDYKHQSFRNDYVYRLIENGVWYGDIEDHDILREITQVFNEQLSYFDNDSQAFYDIVCSLMDISSEWYDKYYAKIFDELLVLIFSNYQPKAFVQPTEITKLITKLSGYNNNGIVYNPFAGLASYGVEMNVTNGYFAQEQNKKIWAVGVLHLLANNINTDNYECEDSVINWKAKYHENDNSKSLFDVIVATPPLGMGLQYEEFSIDPLKPCSTEDFFMARGIEGLTSKGKLIGLFSTGVLFKSGTAEQERKFAVDNDYLEMVISLPANLLYNTSISTTILIFSKNKNFRRHIKFVDGSTFFKKRGRVNVLLVNQLLTCIEINDAQFVRIVSSKEIMENDYNLSVGRYFMEKIDENSIPDGFNLIRLANIASVVPGEGNRNKTGQNVKISDLKSDPIDFEIKSSDFEIANLSSACKKITSNALLLSKINTLKPTYCVINEHESVYINNNIIALHVDESQVDIRFLVLELNSERVKRFVNSRLTGTTIQSLNIKDILDIPILLPNIEEQRAKFAGFLEATAINKKEELISFTKIHGLESDIHEQNTFLRHSLAGPVSNIKGLVGNIQAILDYYASRHPDFWDMKVSDKHKLTLKDYLTNLSRDVTKISTTIEKQMKKELSLSDNQMELIDILYFLKRFSEEINENKTHNYTLSFDYDDNYFDLVETNVNGVTFQPKVLANRNLLTDLLNNLTDNAVKHAFGDTENNRIEILLLGVLDDKENPKIQILISNTGKPLPENFTIDDFSRKGNALGAHAGNGFGGWYITEIVKYFGGTIDLIDETGPEGIPESDLATSFEINLPVVYEEKL